ncbi:MAG: hypothetical protein AAFX99_03250, partial [Myxococcota bacterium]
LARVLAPLLFGYRIIACCHRSAPYASEVAALRQELKLSEANYDKLNEEFLDALETIEALEDALGV